MADNEKVYQLKDKTTSFYDDATGLSVTRDEKVKISDVGQGMKTARMIKRGGLIEVKGPPSAPTGAGDEKTGAGATADTLGDDFPGVKALRAGNVTTMTQLQGLTADDLLSSRFKGITPTVAEEILAAVKKAGAKK